MFELIPSKTMREYLKTQGREFTDFEKAALIRNAPNKTLSERIAALGELAESTSDELLKTQIAERIEYENAKLKAISENLNRDSVFVVGECHESFNCGIFWDYGRAVEYAKWYSNDNLHEKLGYSPEETNNILRINFGMMTAEDIEAIKKETAEMEAKFPKKEG